MPPRTVADRKVLITGAASGIGRATALRTARFGGEVLLTDRNAEGLAATAEEIRSRGGRVRAASAFDIADHAAVVAFAEEVHAEHGSLDVVMNVAGISTWGAVEELSHEQWRRLVEINLMGPIHVIETFLPPMIRAGRGGNLVNVSSAAGLLGLPWHAAYSATKFGLRGISEVLRFDLRRHDIGVHLVCPGGVKTGLVDTIEIAGIDKTAPHVRKLTGHFEKRAIAPEVAAAAILRGIEKNRYMVYTSPDIALGYWAQRVFPPGYELAMRIANRQLVGRLSEREA